MRAAMLFWFLMAAQSEAPEALYKRGVAAMEQGRMDEAEPLLERAAAGAKDNAQYWKALGVARAAQQDYRRSIEPFGKACAMRPKLVDVCYYLGRAYYAADRYEEALPPLRTALKNDARKGRVDTALGQSMEALGRAQEAEAHFRAAIGRKDEWLTQARVAYGLFLHRQGRLGDALKVLEDAQEPETPEALTEYARVLLQSDQAEKAVGRLERLVAIAPKDAAARLLLAKAYRRLGRNAEAVRQEQLGLSLGAGGGR